MDSLDDDLLNYVSDFDLTVTITLNEYRQLVAEVANKDYAVKIANDDKQEREQKINYLVEENKNLKTENFEMKKRLEELEEQNEEEE